MHKKRKTQLAVLVATLTATSGLYLTTTTASGVEANCTTLNVLPGSTPESGSNFEIDKTDGANLLVNGASPCIDWLEGGTKTDMREDVFQKDDILSKNDDDSFGQGTAENNPDPTIVTGSIPPKKSDLKSFGVVTEGGKFLQLFWSRVQNPSGTTNMDFELNKKFCKSDPPPPEQPDFTDCADNGKVTPIPKTPIRSQGDKLISYDLSKGGTVPVISIRSWIEADGEWGPSTTISGGASPLAIGAVNLKRIDSDDSGGLGSLDPFTFGEAVISFEALFGDACGSFGSAYLKSRSSDSFTAEMKDFIAPEPVKIGNCPSHITTAQSLIPNDSAHVFDDDGNPLTGKVTFKLFGPFAADDASCNAPLVFKQENVALVSGVATTTNPMPDSDPVKVTQPGTYKWEVSYGGDGTSHDPSTISCGTEKFTFSNS